MEALTNNNNWEGKKFPSNYLCIGFLITIFNGEIIMDGSIFGLVDNGVLALCAYIGLDVERKLSQYLVQIGVLKKDVRVGLGAIVGGLIGNTLSDFLGAVADPSMHDKILGIVIGCLIPLALLPLFEILYKRWSA